MGLESTNPNHVIVLLLTHVQDEVTVDVIRRISCKYGDVKRIAIIGRGNPNFAQVLIEYADVVTATIAKEELNDAEIFEGSCLIRAEYSSVDEVRVYRNDTKHWDFTRPFEEGHFLARSSMRPPKRGHPGDGPDGGPSYQPPPRRAPLLELPPVAPYRPELNQRSDPEYQAWTKSVNTPTLSHSRSDSLSSGSPVLMVYGIDQERFSCDKLFNLFCVYGNCIRVKFLLTKRDSVMVEMASAKEAQTVKDNLQGIELFGCKLEYESSRQKNVTPVDDPFPLPDGTLSYADYTGNKNHRFIDARTAQRNRIVKPSKQLYWFDAPPGIHENGIRKIFQLKRSAVPELVTKFNIKTEKVSVGTCDFLTVEEATEALMLCNHSKVQLSQQSDQFVIKFAFSGPLDPSHPSRRRGHHHNNDNSSSCYENDQSSREM